MTEGIGEAVLPEVVTPETVVATIILTLSVGGQLRAIGQNLDRPRLNMMIVTGHQDLLAMLEKSPPA